MHRSYLSIIAIAIVLTLTQPNRIAAEGNATDDAPSSVIEWPMEENFFGRAHLESRSGSHATGVVDFAKAPRGGGLLIQIKVANAKPGLHGVHLHKNGSCGLKDSSAVEAGPHWNPTAQPHGAPLDPEHHLGDLGNILVGRNGAGIEIFRADQSHEAEFGGWDSLLGTSVVVHQNADDLISQPSGSSGDRIACGVVQALR